MSTAFRRGSSQACDTTPKAAANQLQKVPVGPSESAEKAKAHVDSNLLVPFGPKVSRPGPQDSKWFSSYLGRGGNFIFISEGVAIPIKTTGKTSILTAVFRCGGWYTQHPSPGCATARSKGVIKQPRPPRVSQSLSLKGEATQVTRRSLAGK